MQEKPVDQLSFIKTPKAIPTVEIDIDSIPKTLFIDDLIYGALKKYAGKKPKALGMV